MKQKYICIKFIYYNFHEQELNINSYYIKLINKKVV